MRPLHLLLVEDEPEQSERVRHSIEGQPADHTVDEVMDGESALEYLRDAVRDGRDLPDLILLDLHLPGKDGLEVLHEIKDDTELRNIPVVVLTSSRAEADVARAYAHHANSYLVKPVEYPRLAEMIETVTRYWGDINRKPRVPAEGRR